MFKRNQRILWLLNHKTLMPFEAGLLIELGYEVFTPKVLPPASRFRSAAVDYQYDKSLSIPWAVLRRLNEFDFYESEWPADIVTLVNRYFGSVFIIPFGKQVPEALVKFEGNILFRAFGLDNSLTYMNVLQSMYGARVFAWIAAAGSRFWFAQGYEQLVECEAPLLEKRSVFLPIGVPDSFWETADQYTGTDRRILFVCPNLVTNPYYAAVYQAFKRDFGDLPHVIVGAQDVEVDDPHVAGFVSTEELHRLFRECAVNYYHSTERRHVHYSPVEAAINGMPVVYYTDSLLGRVSPGVTLGRCESLSEARSAIERILSGDAEFTAAMQRDQHALSYVFSGPYCRKVWQKEVVRSGYAASLRPESRLSVWLRELRRTLLRPYAKGLLRRAPSKSPPMPTYVDLGMDEPDIVALRTLDEGIDFREETYPWFVVSVTGVSYPEAAGRWSTGSTIRIDFVEELPRHFRMTLTAGGYGDNIGEKVPIRIGKGVQHIVIDSDAGSPMDVITEWQIERKVRRIDVRVPHPTMPSGDNRSLGLALQSLRIETLP